MNESIEIMNLIEWVKCGLQQYWVLVGLFYFSKAYSHQDNEASGGPSMTETENEADVTILGAFPSPKKSLAGSSPTAQRISLMRTVWNSGSETLVSVEQYNLMFLCHQIFITHYVL